MEPLEPPLDPPLCLLMLLQQLLTPPGSTPVSFNANTATVNPPGSTPVSFNAITATVKGFSCISNGLNIDNFTVSITGLSTIKSGILTFTTLLASYLTKKAKLAI